MTAFLRGGNKDLKIGDDLEIGKDHECGALSKVEGEFFLREGGVQRYPIGFPCAVTARASTDVRSLDNRRLSS